MADVGCGGGRALLRCAEAYPASEFVGFDAHGRNVERARRAAAGGITACRRSPAADRPP
ncbi:MAG: methyltransferase domain-containing protein [Streptosporangiales bacterium]|nr:methyltransferase domain-containing protein [Streptosporangiales bacterium]